MNLNGKFLEDAAARKYRTDDDGDQLCTMLQVPGSRPDYEITRFGVPWDTSAPFLLQNHKLIDLKEGRRQPC